MQKKPTVVKKYANRRLYDTGRSAYVTLEDIYEMVKEEYDFVVLDAKSGKNLTKQVLIQIIVEKDSKTNSLFTLPFLKKLISLYDDNLQSLVPDYLEKSINNFVENREELSGQLAKSIEQIDPVTVGTTPPTSSDTH